MSDNGNGMFVFLGAPVMRQSVKAVPWPYGIVINIIVNRHFLVAEEHWPPKKLMQVFGTTVLNQQQLMELVKQKSEIVKLLPGMTLQIVIRLAGANGAMDQQGQLIAWGSATGFD